MNEGITRVIREIVNQEFAKDKFPFSYMITVEPGFSELFPSDETSPDTYGIEILLGETPFMVANRSGPRFSFTFDCAQRALIDGLIDLKEEQGRGYGRQLVGLRERVGRRLNCTKILLDLNDNSPLTFWQHMGYVHGMKLL
jgi:GNAT superfamily N-acetyltransferase